MIKLPSASSGLRTSLQIAAIAALAAPLFTVRADSPAPRIHSLTTCADPAAGAVPPLQLKEDDHIAILGNVLPDRMQFNGYLETLIHSRYSQQHIVVRNLSAAGDEVATWHRSEDFGSRDHWLGKTQASVVFAFYGFNESFKGAEGLPQFKADLDKFLKDMAAANFSGKGAPRVVLFSPAADEKMIDPNFPDPTQTNANLALYSAAMAEVAKANNVEFVDLLAPTAELFAQAAKKGQNLTINGHYLTEEAYKELAPIAFRSIFDETAPAGDFEKLRAAVNEKNWQWHMRYRTIDGYNVYGGRSHMAYPTRGGKITNMEVMQEEMSQRDVITANRDKVVFAAAMGKDLQPDDSNLPPVETVETNHPGPNPDKSWPFLGGEEAISKMTVAKGCKVNLFASEEQFPELIKPLQMAWDTKGRLWVSVWRNYPERTPTSKVGDSILIFEDTKGTGHADKCTHFVDDLNAPTGFQFYKDGILLMQAPDLWYIKDTTGGDHANYKERILMGMDSADSHHTTNAMSYDPGGAVYLSDGVFHRTQVETAEGAVRNEDGCVWRFVPATGHMERYAAYGFANPHGKVWDYWGNDIITDATGNASYFGEAFSGHIDYPLKHAGMNQFWARPSRPCPGTGMMTSRQFPSEFWGNFLNCNVIGFQGIYRVKVEQDGSGIKGTTLEDLVSSSDPLFRPSQVNVGPDGAVYFSDWSNSIIGHLQHHLRDPNRDHTHGRIYRMIYEGRPLVQQPRIAGQPLPALVELLKAPEDHIRTLAKIEMGKHPAAEVIAAVDQWGRSLDKSDPAYEHHLTEALWVHQWENVVDVDLLKRMLRSPEPHARTAATRVLTYWRNQVPDALVLLKGQALDESPMVRLQAIRGASFFPTAEAVDVVFAAQTLAFKDDYYLTYTIGESLKQLDKYYRAAIAEGKMAPSDNAGSIDYLVHNIKADELLKLPHSDGVLLATIVRADIPEATRTSALNELAQLKKTTAVAQLLSALSANKGDKASEGALARLLPLQAAADLKSNEPRLTELASSGNATVRAAAYAAIATADQSIDGAYKLAPRTPEGLAGFFDSLPLIFDQDVRATALPILRPILNPDMPTEMTSQAKGSNGVKGRYVRIELPHKGTLTLAEVQVISGGRDVAIGARARQSSTYAGGEASRAIDGHTDGDFGAGFMSHTKENDAHPWWEVDLGREYPIQSIVIWNRTEGNGAYGKRLDGYTLEVLDQSKGEVYKQENNPAPLESARHVLGNDPLGTLRVAAIRAAVSIAKPKEMPETFAQLVTLIEKGDHVTAAAEGIRALPRRAWDPAAAPALTQSLVAWAKDTPVDARTNPDYAETVQFATDLAGLLPEAQAAALRQELKALRVDVFVVHTVREQMRYDTPRLVVEAGKPFEIILENGDMMPHNLAIVNPGTRPTIAAQSATMKPDAVDSEGRAFMPRTSDILAATKLVEPGQSQTLKVTAPSKEGDYEYFCTYPGHWEIMWGKLIVTKDVDAYLAAHPNAAPAGAGGAHMHHPM